MPNKLVYLIFWFICFSAFSQNKTYQFDIQAQPLNSALTRLSRQTDLPIVFSFSRVQGFFTPELRGEFEIMEALSAILADTQLKATITQNGVIVISDITPKIQQTTPKPSPQNNATKSALEVILVTASKRLSDVQKQPNSIVVLTGQELAASNNLTLEDASRDLPMVNISQAQAAENIFIRGVGSGINQGFEQSVGLFIDGVYFGRGRSARNQLFDLARVEILQGPQSTLYGKNTVAGVINIVNKLPSFDSQGYMTTAYEFANNTKKLEGAYTTPLSETLAIRIGGRKYTTDGYLKNSFTQSTQPKKDEGLLRASILWEQNNSFDLNFKLEVANSKVLGRPTQLTEVSSIVKEIQLQADPDAEFIFDYHGSNSGTGPIYSRQLDSSDSYNSTLNFNYYGDSHTITATTGINGYQYVEFSDADSLSVGYLQQERSSDFKSLSQEIRLTSRSFDDFEYMFGAHFLNETLQHTKSTHTNSAAIPALLEQVVSEYQVPAEALTATRVQNFEQETTSYALFVDTNIKLTKKLSLNSGLRWTHDKKIMDKYLIFNHLNSDLPHALANQYMPSLGIGVPHTINNLQRKESALSGGINLSYQALPKVLWYGKYSRGFKAGGFDEDNISGQLPSQEFGKESVNAFELGVKSWFNNNKARLNIALFHSEFSDLQVSTFGGLSSFNVGNAPQATSKGIESDLFVKLTNSLDMHLAIGLLDASYNKFVDGPSIEGGNATTDLSGRNLQYSPDVTVKLSLSKSFTLFGLMDSKFELNAFYTSGFDIPGDLDPVLAQPSYLKFDSKWQLFLDESGWDLSLIAKNLTNKKTTSWGNNVPSSLVLGKSYFQFIDPPRTVMLQAIKHF